MYEWDLANETGHQTLLTMAPRNLVNQDKGEVGLMISRGAEKVILKSDSKLVTEKWGSYLYLAIICANGGNPDLYAFEAKRMSISEGAKDTLAIFGAETARKVHEISHAHTPT